MRLDDDIVAASPASVYRVFKQAGRLVQKWQKPSRKGTGFLQPLQPHEHGHNDVAHMQRQGYVAHYNPARLHSAIESVSWAE